MQFMDYENNILKLTFPTKFKWKFLKVLPEGTKLLFTCLGTLS